MTWCSMKENKKFILDDLNYQNFYIFFDVKLHHDKKFPIAK